MKPKLFEGQASGSVLASMQKSLTVTMQRFEERMPRNRLGGEEFRERISAFASGNIRGASENTFL
jgi:hypothetical protein